MNFDEMDAIYNEQQIDIRTKVDETILNDFGLNRDDFDMKSSWLENNSYFIQCNKTNIGTITIEVPKTYYEYIKQITK